MIREKLCSATRILLMVTFAAMVFVGTAMGRYPSSNKELTFAMSAALIVLFSIGFIFNYYGWKLHHIFVSLIGFIIGFVISGAIVGLIFSSLIGLAFFFAFRKLATKVEKAMIMISAFLVGAVVQPLLILTFIFPPWRPASHADTGLMNFIWLVSFFISIAYVWISLKVYRFFIILTMSLIGSIMMNYTIQYFIPRLNPLDVLLVFVILLFSGISTQYMRKIQSDEASKLKYRSTKVLGGMFFIAVGLYILTFSISNASLESRMFLGYYSHQMLTLLGWTLVFTFGGVWILYKAQIRLTKLDQIAVGLIFGSLFVINNVESGRSILKLPILSKLFPEASGDIVTTIKLLGLLVITGISTP